jgi:hypothetical protein
VNEDRHGRRKKRRKNDPDRALAAGLRIALIPSLCFPGSLASLGTSATGDGIPFTLASPLAAIVLIVNIACWWRVVRLWRALPRPEDDEQGWRRSPGDEPPRGPGDGPGGLGFDWDSFERQFWAHVHERDRDRRLALV